MSDLDDRGILLNCPKCGRRAEGQTAQQIVSSILEYPKGTKLVLYAPLEKQRKGEHRESTTAEIAHR